MPTQTLGQKGILEMALLGAHWHAITGATLAVATGGAAANGFAFAGYRHSLCTTPDLVLPVLSSVTPITNAYVGGLLVQAGGNASQATVGQLLGSCASACTVAFDLYAAYIWSGGR